MAPNMGIEGEARASADEVRSDRAGRPVTERSMERTMCPEVSSMGNGETKSTPVVCQRGLRDEVEAAVRSYERGEGRRSSEAKGVNPLVSSVRFGIGEEGRSELSALDVNSPWYASEVDGRLSADLFVSSPCHDSAYYMAATERVAARRTSSCPKERWSTTVTKGTKSSDKRNNKVNAQADSIRHSPSSSKRSTQRTTERRILVFVTPELEEGESRVKTRAVPNIRFVFASAPNSGPNRLFVFGRIVLPRPNMNSERLFSTAGDTFSDTRSCLHADNMERLIFLKANVSFMG